MRHQFTHLTELPIQRSFHHHRKFRLPTHTYHQTMPQTTTQHNSTRHMETIISDNLERRNKIILRDITMISIKVTTIRRHTHLTWVRRAQRAVKTSISQPCLKVHRKHSREHHRGSDIHHNRHYQFHQILAIKRQTLSQRQPPKGRHVEGDSKTRVPRVPRLMTLRLLRMQSRRKESLFGI